MSRFLHCSSVMSSLIPYHSSRGVACAARAISSICSVYNNGFSSTWQRLNCTPLYQEGLNFSSKYNFPIHTSVSGFHVSKIIGSAEDYSKYPEERNNRHRQQHEDEDEDYEEDEDEDFSPRPQSQSMDLPDGDGIIDRLRRLSMTPADEYELSPVAHEKVREMAKLRKDAMARGEDWNSNSDQRNVRPGGPPQSYQRRDVRMRSWDDEDDNNFGRRQYRDRDDFQDRRRYGDRDDFQDRRRDYRDSEFRQPTRRNQYEEEDGPQDYEVAMQKLKERMDEIKASRMETERANKANKQMKEEAGLANKHVEEGADFHSSEGSSESSKLSNPAYRSLRHSSEKLSDTQNYDNHAQPQPINQHKHNHEEMIGNQRYIPEEAVSLSIAADDPDTFGNLTIGSTLVKDIVGQAIQKELNEEAKALSIVEEEEEEDDTRFTPPNQERWTQRKLIVKVRALLKEQKLKEAVDTYLTAIREGGFHFYDNELRHHFNVLINECANVGYVEMAFRLFKMMKDRGYKENVRTTSSLLNACANSPWDKEKNLDRIEKLLLNMHERGREPNLINYCALIKAYGRLGEISFAFGVVDQILEEGKFQPNTNVFNMLLQACITDTKNGFRHAVITWKKMQSMKIKPDIYSYNLLLRAIRDCGIELQIPENENIKQISSNKTSENIYLDVPVLPPIITDDDSKSLLNYLIIDNPSNEESQLAISNLQVPTILDMKGLKEALHSPNIRLALLGGVRGILTQMVRDKVPPNLKTLAELVDCANAEELSDILQLFKAYKMKGTVLFYTQAIRRANKLKREKTVKEIIRLMNADNIAPNAVTYSALALGCRTMREAKELLKEMEDSNCRPDIYIMTALQAAAGMDFNPMYFLYIMEETRRREILVTELFLNNCENFREVCQRALVSKEMEKEIDPKLPFLARAIERNPNFAEQFAIFKMRYKTWLKSVEIKVDPKNPWSAEFRHFIEHKKHMPVEAEVLAFDPESAESVNASAKNG